ncbi:MAG: ATP-grasp fold amidoligase family protein [Xanthobacteraceae bacterium]
MATKDTLALIPPEADTRLWPSLVKTLAKPKRWSSLVVASHIVVQLALLVAAGKWPKQPSGGNVMRGVDFYPWRDLLRALVRSAELFKAENGYLPPLAFPVSFNEQIFSRKFFAPLPFASLSDKLAAKDYVKARVGDEVLPFVAWSGADIRGLFAAELPAGSYFLKASNGWESHLLLNLPDDLSAKRDEIERWAASELGSWFGYELGEWQYCTLKPRLFLERFIEFNGIQAPEDYKFFCFRGQARLIEVDVDRFTELRSGLYTPEWKYIPVNYGETPVQRPRPRNLGEMIRVAETIAEGMDFARIDLYSDGNSQIRFGEITFTPGNGVLHFSKRKFDRWLGSLFNEDPNNHTQWEC